MRSVITPGLLSWFMAIGCSTGFSQVLATGETWTYRLLDGSYLINDCLVCGRPTILEPLRGSFTLAPAGPGNSNRYDLQNIMLVAARGTNVNYQVSGSGSYELLTSPSNEQRAVLRVAVNDKQKVFTNGPLAVERLWPMIEVDVDQTDVNLIEFYRLHVRAAPLREIWFSSETNLTSTAGNETNNITSGDLLSTTGRTVRSNYGLLSKLGVMPFAKGDYGLDAVDIMPGGEIVFSIEKETYSETLGRILKEGDLLSIKGRLVSQNRELVAAFAPSPGQTNFGLDAVKVFDAGEIFYSIRTNFFSARLGRPISRGDLLSNRGVVIKTEAELLARFHPALPAKEKGLDGFYFWPSGEIWFSTEEAFFDNEFGEIGSGDLLSDHGYRVFTNDDFFTVAPGPERPKDFGLDSFFVVTDGISRRAAPVLAIVHDSQNERLRISWEGQGRVFQLESAPEAAGPYAPIADLDVERFFVDSGAIKERTNRFYRVRQW